MIISRVEVRDIRFPTSSALDGSDAMNPDPDYSAAYVILYADTATGHGLTFTIGRGNELCVAAAEALAPLVIGWSLEEITQDMGAFWRRLAGDSQLRWVGPEKGVIHLALAAIINAVWDLWAKSEQQPVWKVVTNLTPEQFVSLIDFRHLQDVLSPEEALGIRERAQDGQREREFEVLSAGFPAYTTSAGWLGYPDEKIRRLCREAIAAGWEAIKIKVGRDLADDRRRCAIVREEIGPNRRLMIDANQVWEVHEAINWVNALAEFDPWWIEEPVSPDDILGHAKVRRATGRVKVATGEHAHNRIMFKQFLEADAIDVVQFDNCRLGGLNEALAVMLLAAKFGKPVCPHAGGVGLCQYAPHLSIIDYLCVGGSLEGRMTEHADHLHEHFVRPVELRHGRYRAPEAPGFGAELRPASIADHLWPNGPIWRRQAQLKVETSSDGNDRSVVCMGRET
jgi:L-fuconate dehydratase